MYMSAGESWRSLPVVASMMARRCSKKASLMTPVSCEEATRGPAARGAFSMKRTAMDLPSGDHLGEARKTFTLVSFLTGPPAAETTYSWRWLAETASERKAIFLLSGDLAMLASSRGAPAAAVMRRDGVFPSAEEM